MPEGNSSRLAAKANKLYWQTSQPAGRLADELGISRSKFYALIEPIHLAVRCPDCGEASLRKKISAAAFRLKGSGWYETDFKTKDKKNLAGDSDKSENKSAPSTEKAASKDASSTGESKKSA